ncbi:MAG: DUF2490 domain-containing protein [Gammaproteobacteria bacterium]
MKKRSIAVVKCLPLIGMIYLPAVGAATNDMGGTWNSLTLSGDFKTIAPSLNDFHWVILEQARTRDDNSGGMRFSENLLFGQIGYSLNSNASIWLGYMHDWIHPLNKQAFQESRPYQDFLWKSNFDELKFTARSRLEERIRQDTGNVGMRARQLFQVNYPLKFIAEDLSVYAGDELMVYLNPNAFGRGGFTENRAFGGVSYQFTKQWGADLGYLGQYIFNKTGNNVFTHNVQFNLRYSF